MGSRGDVRSPRRAALAGLGVLGGIAILLAAPAGATVTATITSPAANASYSAYQKLAPDATVAYGSGDSGTASLTASDPAYGNDPGTGCSFAVASAAYPAGSSGGSVDVSGPLDLASAYPKSCPAAVAGRPAVNGTWKLTVSTTSGASAERTFTTAVPPVAPTGVKGSSGAPLTVTVTWAPNPELDTHAYAVLDGQGAVAAGPTDASDACSAASCTATFVVGQPGGQSFAVRAYRYPAAPAKPTSATKGDLTADSGPEAVTVMAKPAPASTPSPTPAANGGTGSGTGSSSQPAASSSPAAGPATPGRAATPPTTGQPATTAKPAPAGVFRTGGSGPVTLHNTATGAEAAKISAEFKTFAAPAGIDKLPPLPKLDAATGTVTDLPQSPATDDGEPTDDGTFKVSLGYGPESKTIVTRTVTPGAPLASVADAIGVSPAGLWQSLAGSLVLLLLAGHVRRWARAPIE